MTVPVEDILVFDDIDFLPFEACHFKFLSDNIAKFASRSPIEFYNIHNNKYLRTLGLRWEYLVNNLNSP
jgi:hypothetical protein